MPGYRVLKRLFLLNLAFVAFAANAENMVIPGSGASEFIVRQLAQAFNASQKEHTVEVPTTSGTAGALRDVRAGKVVLGRVGRSLRKEELEDGLNYFPFARDRVVFVAGEGVRVRGITHSNVIDILGGKILRWNELGGDDHYIRAIGREATDSSIRAISKVIPSISAIQFGENVKVVHLDNQMIELLDRFSSSFGFLNRSALFAAKTKLVILELDSIVPSVENFDSGKYQIFTELGLVYRKSHLTAGGRKFIDFILSAEGRKILKKFELSPSAAQ